MKAKERDEIITVFQDALKHLKANLNESVYLCMLFTVELQKTHQGGYNDRMLPQALNYFISQKPTVRRNSDHYYGIFYDRDENLSANCAWWEYYRFPITDKVATNMEKVRFIEHLINKLKK